MSLEDRILELLLPVAQQLAREATQAAREELLMQLGAVKQVPATPILPPRREKRHVPTHCIFPDCKNPSKGPRFTFTCDEHYGIPKAQKAKYLSAWKDSSR